VALETNATEEVGLKTEEPWDRPQHDVRGRRQERPLADLVLAADAMTGKGRAGDVRRRGAERSELEVGAEREGGAGIEVDLLSTTLQSHEIAGLAVRTAIDGEMHALGTGSRGPGQGQECRDEQDTVAAHSKLSETIDMVISRDERASRPLILQRVGLP